MYDTRKRGMLASAKYRNCVCSSMGVRGVWVWNSSTLPRSGTSNRKYTMPAGPVGPCKRQSRDEGVTPGEIDGGDDDEDIAMITEDE
jgi:hypothetical protein